MIVMRPAQWRGGGLVLSSLGEVQTMLTRLAEFRAHRGRDQQDVSSLLDHLTGRLRDHFTAPRRGREPIEEFQYDFTHFPEEHVFGRLMVVVERVTQRSRQHTYLLSVLDLSGEDVDNMLAGMTLRQRAVRGISLMVQCDLVQDQFQVDFDEIMNPLRLFPWYRTGDMMAHYIMETGANPQGDHPFLVNLVTEGDVRISLELLPDRVGHPSSWERDRSVIFGLAAISEQEGFVWPRVQFDVTLQSGQLASTVDEVTMLSTVMNQIQLALPA